MSAPLRILVVRRDNIGDLVCTTPLFTALRQRFPEAWIGALVNSYNAPVLQGNPDLSEIFACRKLKHREEGDSLLSDLWTRYRLITALRRQSLDYIVLAGNAARAMSLARLLRPKSVVGSAASGTPPDVAIEAGEAKHEVQITFRLAQAFGIGGGGGGGAGGARARTPRGDGRTRPCAAPGRSCSRGDAAARRAPPRRCRRPVRAGT